MLCTVATQDQAQENLVYPDFETRPPNPEDVDLFFPSRFGVSWHVVRGEPSMPARTSNLRTPKESLAWFIGSEKSLSPSYDW